MTWEIKELGPETIPSKDDRIFVWQPEKLSELISVELFEVEGELDVKMVLIGYCMQTAFQRRPRLVHPDLNVRIVVENYGKTMGQCAVEVRYREVT